MNIYLIIITILQQIKYKIIIILFLKSLFVINMLIR